VDGNETGEIDAGMIVMVTEGNIYKDTQWKLTTNDPIIIGTTALTFEQNSAFAFGNVYANGTAVLANIVGDSITLTPGNNISITGNNTSKTVTIGATGVSTTTASASSPSSPEQGDIWIDTDTGIQYIYFNDGTGNQWAEMEAQTSYSYYSAGGVPGGNDSEVQFNDGGVFGGSGNFTFDKTYNSGAGLLSVGYAQGGVIQSDELYACVAVTSYGPVTASGDVTGGNFSTLGNVSAYGNIDGGNLITTGEISASGNVVGGNLTTGAQVVATGNITGGNLTTTGAVYSNFNTNTANTASFNATGGNTKGGTGYLDFLVARNTSGGATNPYKWFRLNSTGGLEIINSAYTTNLFNLSDAGALSIPGPISISGKQAVNGPAFSAYAAATLQTIPNGTQTKVLFQTEEFDTNSNYASSRFTPTVEGYYQLNAEVRLDGATGTGECMIILYKNGSEYKRGWNSSGTQWASNFWAMTVSSLVYANGTSDYFEIYVQQGSGGSISVTAVNNSAITWFNGCMLRGA
jgi:hypothetical protein